MKLHQSRITLATASVLFTAAVWSQASVAIDFPGAPKLPGMGNNAAPAAGKADPDAFLQRAQTAEGLLKSSLTAMSGALLSKEKAAEFKAQQDKADLVTDPKEKQAQESEVIKSQSAAVTEALNDASLKSKVDKMDGDHKKLLAASAYNYALGLLQEKALSGESRGLISGLGSNPTLMSKLGKVKDAASSIASQLSIHASLLGKMPAVFSAVGVQAPTSADDKPKQITAVPGI